MKIGKFNIKFNTLFKKGLVNKEDSWGVYCITGFQGSGKSFLATFLLVEMLKKHNFDLIVTNIKSLKLKNKMNDRIVYFSKISDITSQVTTNSIYIIDEISKKYTKECKTDTLFYSWLQQSRKRGRIVILITQEWKEVPMWLRRPVRFMYYTRQLRPLPFFLTTKGDALNTTFNTETNEWECPILEFMIYKRTQEIGSLYDTFEPINEL